MNWAAVLLAASAASVRVVLGQHTTDKLHDTADLDHLEDQALSTQRTGHLLFWPAAWDPA